jgi:hypothetical protein
MKNWSGLIITLAVIALFLGGLFAAVNWPRSSEVDVWGEDCLDQNREKLKDPQSAYVINAQLYESGSIKRSVITVSAENSIGGRDQVVFKCRIIDGEVR